MVRSLAAPGCSRLRANYPSKILSCSLTHPSECEGQKKVKEACCKKTGVHFPAGYSWTPASRGSGSTRWPRSWQAALRLRKLVLGTSVRCTGSPESTRTFLVLYLFAGTGLVFEYLTCLDECAVCCSSMHTVTVNPEGKVGKFLDQLRVTWQAGLGHSSTTSTAS